MLHCAPMSICNSPICAYNRRSVYGVGEEECVRDYLQRHAPVWLVLMCIAAFLAAEQSPVSSHGGDTWGSFLTAQALVQYGTLSVDPYIGTAIARDDARFIVQNGHRYDFFPVGSAILLAPFVWNENLRGHLMTRIEELSAFENTISALSVALSALLIYLAARGLLDAAASLLLTVLFTFGTAIMSTMSTAFWSINPALLCSLLVVAMLVRDACGTRVLNPYLLGVVLFVAYVCRPSLSLLIGVVGVYLLMQRRASFWRLLATLLLCGAGFVAFSLAVYGSPVPPYYMPQRLDGAATFWTALFGNLFSPARGLLVFSPFLVLLFVGMVLTRRTLVHQPLFWLALGWFALHWVAVSRFPHWWGGYSFGSRLMADILPALLLLALLVWKAWPAHVVRRWNHPALGLLVATGVIAIWINVSQGLWNRAVVNWNIVPDIDRYPEYLFDWRYPQFLASIAVQPRREADHVINQLLRQQPMLTPTGLLPIDAPGLWLDWYMPEESGGERFRWSRGETSSIIIRMDETLRHEPLGLSFALGTNGPQRIMVWLNGVPMGNVVHPGYAARRYHLLTSPAWVQTAGMQPITYAEVELRLPGVQPGADGRAIGARLLDLSVIPMP